MRLAARRVWIVARIRKVIKKGVVLLARQANSKMQLVRLRVNYAQMGHIAPFWVAHVFPAAKIKGPMARWVALIANQVNIRISKVKYLANFVLEDDTAGSMKRAVKHAMLDRLRMEVERLAQIVFLAYMRIKRVQLSVQNAQLEM